MRRTVGVTHYDIQGTGDWGPSGVAVLDELDADLVKRIREWIPAFWHFTDKANIALMEEAGGILSVAELEESGIEVPRPGGNEWSRDADRLKGLERYVHLCLRPNHPMAYRAQEDGRITDLRWLKISTEVLEFDGVLISPDVANKSGVSLLKVRETPDLVSWDLFTERPDFKDPEQHALVSKYEKVEVLVPNVIPWEFVTPPRV